MSQSSQSFFFFNCFVAIWGVPCMLGLQFPDQWLNSGRLRWEHGALATGPPGKSLVSLLSRIIRPLPPPHHLNSESDCSEAWKGEARYVVRLAATCGARARRPGYAEPERLVQMPAGQAGSRGADLTQ